MSHLPVLRRLTFLVGALILAGQSPAQSANTFDVASIKVNRSGERGFSTGGMNGGRYQARNIPAKILVAQAFGVRESQIVNAPGWMDSERYDIVAKANPDLSGSGELKILLQSMLADRFRLSFHRETKEVPGYSLVIAKSGYKIKRNSGSDTPDLKSSSNRAGAKISATRMPISELSKQLEGELDGPVADRTGLTGTFDFQLEWTHEPNGGDASSSLLTVVREQLGLKYPSIFTAVQEQLGLKLDSTRKVPIEVVVIDKIEKASEN
jgi:bla regulator protein blaR1